MTDFDKEVIEKPRNKKEVVKNHIKDKLTEAVRDSLEPKEKNGNPLEAWKREQEEKIADENYPYNGAGRGYDMGVREKNVDPKPDDYDEQIQSKPKRKKVKDTWGNWVDLPEN